MEVTMGDIQTMRDRPKEKLRGRERRSLNLSTKLTAIEARVIEDAATHAGRTPGEWTREALLRAAQGGSSDPLFHSRHRLGHDLTCTLSVAMHRQHQLEFNAGNGGSQKLTPLSPASKVTCCEQAFTH
jgi:hypothetical protein